MKKLNYDTYKLLLNAELYTSEHNSIDNINPWYALTHNIFKNPPLNCINDLWKIVAFAYSWMPRIPFIYTEKIINPDELLIQLQALKSGDSSNLKSLLEQLVPVINNSLTGTSKVLHFIAPDYIPIIDSNVLWGWDIFFGQLYPDYGITKLPHYTSILKNSKEHIAMYLKYTETLNQWVANSEGRITIRELEFAFYTLSKKIGKSQKIYSM